MERELAERSILLHLVSIGALGVIWRPPLDERQYTRLSSEGKERVELGGEVMKGASREKWEKKGAGMMIDNGTCQGVAREKNAENRMFRGTVMVRFADEERWQNKH